MMMDIAQLSLSHGMAWQRLLLNIAEAQLLLEAVKRTEDPEEIRIDFTISDCRGELVMKGEYYLSHSGRELRRWGACPEIEENIWNLEIRQAHITHRLLLPLFKIHAFDKYFFRPDFSTVLLFILQRFDFVQKISLPRGGRFQHWRSLVDGDEQEITSRSGIDIAFDVHKKTVHLPLISEADGKTRKQIGEVALTHNIPVFSFQFDGSASKFVIFRTYGVMIVDGTTGEARLCEGFSSSVLIRVALTETTTFFWARGSVIEDKIPYEFSMQNILRELALFEFVGDDRYVELSCEFHVLPKCHTLRVSEETDERDFTLLFERYDRNYHQAMAKDDDLASSS